MSDGVMILFVCLQGENVSIPVERLEFVWIIYSNMCVMCVVHERVRPVQV